MDVCPAGTSRPRMGSSLLTSPLLMVRGTRGVCNGSNIHHCAKNLNVKSKSPLPGVPNVEVIYDTSPRTLTRAVRGGSLLEGLRLLMNEQNGYENLRGSGHRNVIPYIHRDSVVLLYVWRCSRLS
jgi:hypothetical protein